MVCKINWGFARVGLGGKGDLPFSDSYQLIKHPSLYGVFLSTGLSAVSNQQKTNSFDGIDAN